MGFSVGRPAFCPRSSGKNIGDFTIDEAERSMAGLTAEEKADVHSKYFYEQFEIPDYLMKTMSDGPMDPAKAFMPHEYGERMNNTGHCEVETGYCILPNGVSYSAALIRQEGLTDEMVDFFNNNFAMTDNLFYKCWCPGYHFRHYNNGCLEDFGFGLRSMTFGEPVKLEDMGLDENEILKNDPNCLLTGGNNTQGYNIYGLKAGITDKDMIAKYHRTTDYGRELRVRIWYGLNLKNGEYEYALPEGGQPLEVARCVMRHIILEETTGVRLMKKFWKDNH